jgi:hypothetical protein
MNHRVGKLAFGFSVGLLVAVLAYRWAADTGPNVERQREENVVMASRVWLESTLDIGPLVIVDPVSPDRKVGKVYVYPAGDRWEISGYYRRDKIDLWHPYLITMDAALALKHVKISDTALLRRNGEGPLEVLP